MKSCRAANDIVGNLIEDECVSGKKRRCGAIYECDDEESDEEEDLDTYEDDICYRCGNVGHWANQCYARRDVDGRKLL